MGTIQTSFIKNLRSLCLIGIFAIGLMTIIATGNGGDSGSDGT